MASVCFPLTAHRYCICRHAARVNAEAQLPPEKSKAAEGVQNAIALRALRYSAGLNQFDNPERMERNQHHPNDEHGEHQACQTDPQNAPVRLECQ